MSPKKIERTDIEFSSRFTPKHGHGDDAVSLTGYKWSIYLEVTKTGCCPGSAERLEISLSPMTDLDKLIAACKRAKAAARKAGHR